MSKQIIKQPDGKYAVWSSNVDAFILIDATPEEIIEEWTNDERLAITEKVTSIIESLNAGQQPYHQFTKSWDDAVATYEQVHKRKFDMDILRKECE